MKTENMEHYSEFDIAAKKNFTHPNQKISEIASQQTQQNNEHCLNNLNCPNPSMIFERASLFFNECRDIDKNFQNNCTPGHVILDKTDQDFGNKLTWKECQNATHSCHPNYTTALTSYPVQDHSNSLFSIGNIAFQRQNPNHLEYAWNSPTPEYNLDLINYTHANTMKKSDNDICLFFMLTLMLVYVINYTLRCVRFVLEKLQNQCQNAAIFLSIKMDALMAYKYLSKNSVKRIIFATIFIIRGSNLIINWLLCLNDFLCKPVPQKYLKKINSQHFIEEY